MGWKLTKANVGRALSKALVPKYEYLAAPRGTVRGGYGVWMTGYEIDESDDGQLSVRWVPGSLSRADAQTQKLCLQKRCVPALEPYFSVSMSEAGDGSPLLLVRTRILSSPARNKT